MGLIKCPVCGQDISSDAKTCIHCGHKQKKGTKGIIGIIFIGVICVLLFGFITGWSFDVKRISCVLGNHTVSIGECSICREFQNQEDYDYIISTCRNAAVKANNASRLLDSYATTMEEAYSSSIKVYNELLSASDLYKLARNVSDKYDETNSISTLISGVISCTPSKPGDTYDDQVYFINQYSAYLAAIGTLNNRLGIKL